MAILSTPTRSKVNCKYGCVDGDVDGEEEEKYEMVQSHGGSTPSGGTVAVQFVVAAESLIQQNVILHDDQSLSAEDHRHCPSASDCPPHTDVTDDNATTV